MTRTSRLDYKEISNGRFTGRLRQAMVLFMTIIAGILISVSLNA